MITARSFRHALSEIILFLCVALFVYAAATKLLDLEKFVVQIGQSPILTSYKRILAWLVPGLEFVIAALMIIPKTRLAGLYAFFGMMTMFTFYIVLASRFSTYIPCSCGGVLENMSWTQHLYFNVFFMVISGVGVMLGLKRGDAASLRVKEDTTGHSV